jgi:hypothetical protein
MQIRFALIASVLVLALSGCGKEEPATPLSLVPESAIVSVVVTEPVAAVRNIDSYIAAGAPFLGAGIVEGEAAKLLELENLDSLGAVGLDPAGSIVFWMESMMPQSMVMAVSITDFPSFLALLGRLGLTFEPGQPLDKLDVFQAPSDNGTIYAAQSRGVALLSMNRAKLGELADALSPEAAVEVAPGSVFASFNIAMIGPMAASQIPMIAQSAASDPEMPPFAANIMDLYFDAAVVFLNQTQRCDITLAFGPEEIVVDQVVVFKEGSDLARLVVTPETPSLLDRIPAGQVLTAQVRLPGELAGIVMNSVYQAMGIEMDPAVVDIWTEMSGCAAMSFFNEGFMSFMAVYNLPEGSDLQGMTAMISDMTARAMAVMPPEMIGMVAFSPCAEAEVQGVPMMTNSFTVFVPGADGAVDTLAFNYWYAVLDDLFLVEVGDEPSGILQAAAGGFSPASEMPGLNPDAMGTYAMEIGGYLGMIRQLSPEDISLPETIPTLWVTGEMTAGNGIFRSTATIPGAELVTFAATLATWQQ